MRRRVKIPQKGQKIYNKQAQHGTTIEAKISEHMSRCHRMHTIVLLPNDFILHHRGQILPHLLATKCYEQRWDPASDVRALNNIQQLDAVPSVQDRDPQQPAMSCREMQKLLIKISAKACKHNTTREGMYRNVMEYQFNHV